jgi:hypothetical protein
MEKIAQHLGKLSQSSAKPKNGKTSASRLNWKVQNNTKPILKPKNTHNKPHLDTYYLG